MKPYNKESHEQAHRLRALRRAEKHLAPLKVENLDQKLFDGMEELSLMDQPTDDDSVVSTHSSTSEELSCAYGRMLPSLGSDSSIPSSPGSLGSVGSSPLTTRSASSRSLFSSDNSECDFSMRSASSEPTRDRMQTATLLRSASLSTSPRPSCLKSVQEKRKKVRRKREFNPLEKSVVASPRLPEKVGDKETVLTLPSSGERISLFRQQVHAWSNEGTEKAGTNMQSMSLPAISNTQGN